jgi:hypothetical protein
MYVFMANEISSQMSFSGSGVRLLVSGLYDTGA